MDWKGIPAMLLLQAYLKNPKAGTLCGCMSFRQTCLSVEFVHVGIGAASE